jgi:dTDP-4-amino-4,6-dideoxygalactose transaminase
VPIPFLRPSPPKLSDLAAELQAIEASGVYSNYGPVNTRLEAALVAQLFGGQGGCLTVNNATTGLMLAIREAMGEPAETAPRRYALMPAFTFAATAQAALWAGLTPLLYDIDPESWLPSQAAEEALLRRHGQEIAVVVPYATFGNCLDLGHYDRLSQRHGVPVVLDAAASLGSLDAAGQGFGHGCRHAVVYSMHATKTFATAEAGLIYSACPERLARLRAMGNFGFAAPRIASLPGLNAKLSEVHALLALARLDGFEAIVERRATLAAAYRALLPGWGMQRPTGRRLAFQFMPVLLPEALAGARPALLARLAARGIGAAHYFSPHLAEQPYILTNSVVDDLTVTDRLSRRALSLPMADAMTEAEVAEVCDALLHEERRAA